MLASLDLSELTPLQMPIVSRWPVYAPDEIAAAAEVLRTGRVNALHHGDWCGALEAGFAELCEMPHGIALANGTLALEVALRALGIGAGDEVIVPARSFMASASCIMACGATPVFADVDPVSQSVTAATITPQLTARTRAIIVVHLAGYPAPMEEIAALAATYDIKVIEDCAQAHGATLRGRPVGSFGDAAAFSFCTDKIMSTGGEGGMLLLRDSAIWRRAWALKDHGKDPEVYAQGGDGISFRWLHQHFGSNYRLTEMQAAIGVRQLAKLPHWIESRRENAQALLDALRGLSALRLIEPEPEIGHAYYKFYAFVRPERLGPGWTRDKIVAQARAVGVPCQTGSCPEIYLEQAFTDAAIGPATRLPMAQMLGETSLLLPVDPTLDPANCSLMGIILHSIIEQATIRDE
ncbi:MAG: DegT/DnrJ/EryC1/StrS family aminotransferase [Sphingobium sp.]|uniref:DegT/DnrJ/EryC1/StrS family aminotransferase n=1 Tax=Sphingobium sp. TaxID=1912891 RepID=UPI0029B180E0|nr:DegT/DnrJ/EryC1/StrS family aminotransferase [Sphingobium sp.]MDX3909604.1 DegT/DnrJ/EryC1/StrS family aminotransferase [Sphingobium sp.]